MAGHTDHKIMLERWTTEAPEDLSLIEVVMALVLGMAFVFWVVKRLPVGLPRLVALLPLLSYYFTIPWRSPFVHIRAILSFFCFWMIPFKLALFCWNLGPVAANPSILYSFPKFFATMSLSIRVPRSNRALNDKNSITPWTTVLCHTAIKLPALFFLFKCYAFADRLPDLVLHFVYSLHVYLGVSLLFEILGIFAWGAFGVELEPSFDEPYLATSVSEFWGKRWNLLVNSLLKTAVYDPLIRGFLLIAGSSLEDKQLPEWPRLCSLLVVFVVSGLMHELIYLCMNKSKATWEVSCFFFLHGLITAAENIVSKRLWRGEKKVPKVLAIPATIFCTLATATWLFFPPIARPGTISKALEEFQLLLNFLHAGAHKIQPL